MNDEWDRLSLSNHLFQLLEHYARPGMKDRETWQDRVMDLPEVSRRDLIRLHGELLAFSWIEQNSGNTPELKLDMAPACYRVTSAGLKAYKFAQTQRASALLDVA